MAKSNTEKGIDKYLQKMKETGQYGQHKEYFCLCELGLNSCLCPCEECMATWEEDDE